MAQLNPKHSPWIIVLVFALVAAIRILGPSDLFQGDQAKQADYVIDIVVRGNWLIQHHEDTIMASKPPLYNWLAAPLMIASGSFSEILLKLPSRVAGLLVLLIVWDFTRKILNPRVGLLAAIFLATNYMFTKQMYFARTDMLVTLFITAQFWAVFRWTQSTKKRAWLAVLWISAAFGILAKGPIAVIIPHLGLSLWWLWMRSWRFHYKKLELWWGIPIAILPAAIWAMAIYHYGGPEVFADVYDRLITTETLSRFDAAAHPGETRSFFYYIFPLIARTLPWSVLTLIAFRYVPWRSFRRKSAACWDQYSGVILAICWLLSTLLFMSVFPSKRIVRVLPAVPPLCILAGWVFDAFLVCCFTGHQTFINQRSIHTLKRIVFTIPWVYLILGVGLIAVILLNSHLAIAIHPGMTLFIALGLIIMVSLCFYGHAKKNASLFVMGLVTCVMLGIMLDRHVLSYDERCAKYQHTQLISKDLLEYTKQNTQGSIMIMQGYYSPALRYLLVHPHRPFSLDEVVNHLETSHEDVYVVGSQKDLSRIQTLRKAIDLYTDSSYELTAIHFPSTDIFGWLKLITPMSLSSNASKK